MNKIESGTIFAIPLLKNKGYCYGKYLHLPEITGHSYDSHLFKVYNYFTKSVDKNIDQIEKSELLYCPFLISGRPKTRGLGWKVIGNQISRSDNFYPDFKEFRGNKWVLVRFYKSGESSEIFNIELQRVEHLEFCILRSELEIPERILMEFLRKKDKNIENELDFGGVDNEMFNTYEKMKGIPIYSKIPEEFRGRVLPV